MQMQAMRALLFSISLLILFFPNQVQARDFETDMDINYRVNENGITDVVHNITLENSSTTLYATSYQLSLSSITPTDLEVVYDGKTVNSTITSEDNTTLVDINFGDAVVGKGKSREFRVSYKVDLFATRTGEVWEVSIPRLGSGEEYRSYKVRLTVPLSFGDQAYISPTPSNTYNLGSNRLYEFNGNSSSKTGVVVGFGKFQVFSFKLNYHLENPLSRTSEVTVAIPPDNAYQKVYYQIIEPTPNKVLPDVDGNWLAYYTLKPKERVDISVTGSVQIFSDPRPFSAPLTEVLQSNTNPSEYWQTDNPQIATLAQNLRTPKAIYDYVVNTLSYDFERVRPNVNRLGAVGALSSPNSAICMEYTDLFIALSRSAGIPAREVNGYAYTENPDIQPLSLVADVLHAWPEYWDNERSAWIPVDPTWGSTTGGVDYFDKLDLRHFAFVMHGDNPNTPYSPGSYKLGPNPQKDVFVSFGQLPTNTYNSPEIEVERVKRIPFFSDTYKAVISNSGLTAIYALPLEIDLGETKKYFQIDSVLPYSFTEVEFSTPFTIFGIGMADSFVLSSFDTSLVIDTGKSGAIITSSLVVVLLMVIIVFVLMYKFNKLRPIYNTLRSRYAKAYKSSKDSSQEGGS